MATSASQGPFEDDLRLFIGPNADAYLAMDRRHRLARICWGGFLAPAIFFLYRRLYALAATTIVLPWLFVRLTHGHVVLPIAAASGAFGSALYLAIARRRVVAIRRTSETEAVAWSRLARQGGVDRAAAWLGVAVLLAGGVWSGFIIGAPSTVQAAGTLNVQAGWPIKALILALLPGVALFAALVRAGAGRVSARALATALSLGAMIAMVPGALSILEALLRAKMTPMADALVTAFVFAGLFEEAAKLGIATLVIPRLVGRRNAPAIILATAAIALGFALLENVNAVIGQAQWERIAVGRALVAVPMHMMLGLYLGRGIVLAGSTTGARRWRTLAITLVVAAVLHGLYDFPLFSAARAPFFPTPMVQAAAAFGMAPALFLSVVFTIAVAATCLQALRTVPSILDGRRLAAVRPRVTWMDRTLAALFGTAAIGLLALFVEAQTVGVSVPLCLPALDGAFVLLSLAALVALSRDAWRGTAGIGLVSGLLGVVMIVAAHTVVDAPRRTLLVGLLVDSGRVAGSEGNFELAERKLTAALTLDPTSTGTLAMRADVESKRHRYDAAVADLDRIVALTPNDALIYALRAQEQINRHALNEALADADHAVRLDPKSAQALLASATVRLARGETAAARDAADKAAALSPSPNVAVFLIQAEIAKENKDHVAARAALDAAVKAAPQAELTWGSRGRLRFDLGDFKGAADDLAHAAALGTDPYTLMWLYLARTRIGEGGPREFAFWAARIDRRDWPGPMVDLFRGQRTIASALRTPRDADQRCEAWFYASEWLIVQGLGGASVQMLTFASKACPKSFVEYDGAVAELARIEASRPRLAPPPPKAAGSPASSATPAVSAPVEGQRARLEGQRCDDAGAAQWHYVPADAARRIAASLTVSASMSKAALDAALEFRPGNPADPVSPIQILFTAPSKTGGIIVDAIEGIGIDGPGGWRPIHATGPAVLVLAGIFRTSAQRDRVTTDLTSLTDGDVLSITLRTRPNGICRLRFAADPVARHTIMAAIDAWRP